MQNRANCCPFFCRIFFVLSTYQISVCKTGQDAVRFLQDFFFSSFLLSKVFMQNRAKSFLLSKFLCKTGQNAVHCLAGTFPSFLLTKLRYVKQGKMLSLFWPELFLSFLLIKFRYVKQGKMLSFFCWNFFVLSTYQISVCKTGQNAVLFLLELFRPFYSPNVCVKQGKMLSISLPELFRPFSLPNFGVQNRAKCCPLFAGTSSSFLFSNLFCARQAEMLSIFCWSFFVLSTYQILLCKAGQNGCPFFWWNFFVLSTYQISVCKAGQNAVHFFAGTFSSFLLTKFRYVKQGQKGPNHFPKLMGQHFALFCRQN